MKKIAFSLLLLILAIASFAQIGIVPPTKADDSTKENKSLSTLWQVAPPVPQLPVTRSQL